MGKKAFIISLTVILAVFTASCGKTEGSNTDPSEVSAEVSESEVPLSSEPAGVSSERKVIYDTDISYLNDDALGLFMLTQADKRGEVDLLGVTTIDGNVSLMDATDLAAQQLELIGREDIPVYPAIDDAADFMIEQVHKYPGQVTIMAVGPATNVAAAIEKDPTFAEAASGIMYLGGNVERPGSSEEEFNWYYDPMAARTCLGAPFKKQLVVTNDFSRLLTLDKSKFDRLRAYEGNKITGLILSNADRYSEDTVFYVWDVVIPAVYLKPEIMSDVGESSDGRLQLLKDIDEEAFWDLFIDLLED
jgi:inosine-uridine nucleoside N-ribohydrolase